MEVLRDYLREAYGRRLVSTSDFKEKACCTTETAGRYAGVLELLPEEVRSKHYGCGCPIPNDDLAGLTVLDLGSGAGVDAFVAAFLVGSSGRVHGVDMTEEQLAAASRAAPVVAKRFGYPASNTEFHHGYIETAEMIPDASVDLVISDCAINLSPRKDLVFGVIRRVLKDNGEFHLSDIVADRRLPEELSLDPRLVAECLGGAEYEHDWFDQMSAAGFPDVRVMSRRVVQEEAKGIPIVFSSVTIRGFKFSDPLDPRCEDYGQAATYRGTVPTSPARFVLDGHHVFETGRPTPVCRNTARMLSETRLGRYFMVTPPVRHFGAFPCGPAGPIQEPSSGPCC